MLRCKIVLRKSRRLLSHSQALCGHADCRFVFAARELPPLSRIFAESCSVRQAARESTSFRAPFLRMESSSGVRSGELLFLSFARAHRAWRFPANGHNLLVQGILRSFANSASYIQ